MAECETSESTSNSFLGIVLVLVACCCYAFGNCMQRYSLLKQPGEKVCGVLNRNLGWLVGALIYFSANGIYAIALSFAPVSVLAAVFSLTIIANALCAVFLLGDKIPRMAYPGYALVVGGSVVFSVTVNAQVCHFGSDELKEIMTSGAAFVYWIAAAILLVGGYIFARWFEKKCPLSEQSSEHQEEQQEDTVEQPNTIYLKLESTGGSKPASSILNDEQSIRSASAIRTNNDPHANVSSGVLLAARFIYPASLGATEAVGALVLKAANSLLTTIATTEDEAINAEVDEDLDPSLWIGLMGVGIILFLGIVFWLRLVYSRFEITGAFPVEFGMLTFGSVVGGFAVFQDHKFVENSSEWVFVSLAGLLILGGIGVVAYASWKAKVDASQHQEGASKVQTGGEGDNAAYSANGLLPLSGRKV